MDGTWIIIGIIAVIWIVYSVSQDNKSQSSNQQKISTDYKPNSYQYNTSKTSSRGYKPSRGLSEKEQAISNAISSGSTLSIRYTKQNGKVSTRTIKPLFIKHEHGCMYVSAFCYLRHEERTFRLSRLEII